MDKKELEQFIAQGKSQRELAREFQCSQPTIRSWLHKYGLRTCASVKAYHCKFCGETKEAKFHFITDGSGQRRRHKSVCARCHSKRTNLQVRKYKAECVKYKGGKCEVCGYDKCLGSLEFHHLDPNDKDPNWHRMRSWKLEKITRELDKCILVCSNCHRELHWDGQCDLEDFTDGR